MLQVNSGWGKKWLGCGAGGLGSWDHGERLAGPQEGQVGGSMEERNAGG